MTFNFNCCRTFFQQQKIVTLSLRFRGSKRKGELGLLQISFEETDFICWRDSSVEEKILFIVSQVLPVGLVWAKGED